MKLKNKSIKSPDLWKSNIWAIKVPVGRKEGNRSLTGGEGGGGRVKERKAKQKLHLVPISPHTHTHTHTHICCSLAACNRLKPPCVSWQQSEWHVTVRPHMFNPLSFSIKTRLDPELINVNLLIRLYSSRTRQTHAEHSHPSSALIANWFTAAFRSLEVIWTEWT